MWFNIHGFNHLQIKNIWKKNLRKLWKSKLEFATHWALCWIHMNDMICRHLAVAVCKYRAYANTMSLFMRVLSIPDFGVHGDPGTNPLCLPKDNYLIWSLEWLQGNMVISPFYKHSFNGLGLPQTSHCREVAKWCLTPSVSETRVWALPLPCWTLYTFIFKTYSSVLFWYPWNLVRF